MVILMPSKTSDGEPFDVLKGAPQSVSLGYKTFTVHYIPIGLFSEEQGKMAHTSGMIVVDPTFAPAEVVNTFLHECLHIVWTNCLLGSDDDKPDEEKAVTAMGNGVTELFSRNPDIMKWITRCLSC